LLLLLLLKIPLVWVYVSYTFIRSDASRQNESGIHVRESARRYMGRTGIGYTWRVRVATMTSGAFVDILRHKSLVWFDGQDRGGGKGGVKSTSGMCFGTALLQSDLRKELGCDFFINSNSTPVAAEGGHHVRDMHARWGSCRPRCYLSKVCSLIGSSPRKSRLVLECLISTG